MYNKSWTSLVHGVFHLIPDEEDGWIILQVTQSESWMHYSSSSYEAAELRFDAFINGIKLGEI
jgi:hypothetical protein